MKNVAIGHILQCCVDVLDKKVQSLRAAAAAHNDSEALTSLEDVDAIDADMEARACARIAALTHAPSADAGHLSLSCLVSLFTTIFATWRQSHPCTRRACECKQRVCAVRVRCLLSRPVPRRL